MFKTNSRLGVRNAKVVSHVEARPPSFSGVSKRSETAGFNLAGMMGSNSMSMSIAGGGTGKQLDLMLTGLLPSEDEAVLRRLYLDMYYYDAVSGSCCDLLSNMPFSNFDLIGLDEKDLDIYESSIQRLSLRNMLPEISLDYLVNGLYCATLVFDNKTKAFTDSIPFQPWQVQVIGTPLYSRDPLIKISPDSEMKQFFSENSDYFRTLQKQIPPKLLEAFRSKQFTPDPLTTIYLPRRTFPHQFRGISYLKRALPWYLIEKTIYRGTLVEVGRRLRSLLHIQAGDEAWEPTSNELSSITQMFQQGDFDPLGAIITTRNSVQPTEIRQGGDFFKITDIIDQTTTVKLRALGVSEAFLSGDATYASAETGLSTFLESLIAYRDLIDQKLFYNKLFPVIAVANGLYKDTNAEKAAGLHKDLGYAANDSTNLRIPSIRWHKELRPSNDRDTFDMLQALSDHGVPVPIRMWVAAGGINYSDLIEGLKQNKKDEDELNKFKSGGGGDESDDTLTSSIRAALGSFSRRPGLLDRDFGEGGEAFTTTATGKRRYIIGQRRAHTAANEKIVRSLARMADPDYYAKVARRVDRRMVRNLVGLGG